MYRHIAVPLDGTTESHQALSLAVGIARKADGLVDLVHVHVAFPPVGGTEVYGAAGLSEDAIASLRQIAEQKLQRTTAEVEALGVRVTSAVLQGDVPNALADHFRTSGTDLIVMTTHDRGRLEHLLLGSVAESVVRRVQLPVLLVRAGDGTPTLSSVPRVGRILIPLDGSPFGEQVTPHAEKLAVLMGSEITLLTVVQPVVVAAALATEAGPAADLALPSKMDIDPSDRAEIQSRVLEQTAMSLRTHGVSVHTAALADGNPARAIVEYARKKNIDLIAMTTHGRGALKRLVAGSVSQAVLHTSPTLMLMYRPTAS